MNTDDHLARILSEMQADQRMRDNARGMHGALLFCKGHLEESNWVSEEARLDSLDMALRICDVVLARVEGEQDNEH